MPNEYARHAVKCLSTSRLISLLLEVIHKSQRTLSCGLAGKYESVAALLIGCGGGGGRLRLSRCNVCCICRCSRLLFDAVCLFFVKQGFCAETLLRRRWSFFARNGRKHLAHHFHLRQLCEHLRVGLSARELVVAVQGNGPEEAQGDDKHGGESAISCAGKVGSIRCGELLFACGCFHVW